MHFLQIEAYALPLPAKNILLYKVTDKPASEKFVSYTSIVSGCLQFLSLVIERYDVEQPFPKTRLAFSQ